MHRSVIQFVSRELAKAGFQSPQRLLDIGSYNVNGSLRQAVCATGANYCGLDMRPCDHARCAGAGQPCVDIVADATIATAVEGLFEQWDCVTCCGTIEHIAAWQQVTDNLRRLVRPGGLILVTVPSPGFPRHEYPHDFWRFTPEILAAAFVDCAPVVTLDPQSPGVMLSARRPHGPLASLPRVTALGLTK